MYHRKAVVKMKYGRQALKKICSFSRQSLLLLAAALLLFTYMVTSLSQLVLAAEMRLSNELVDAKNVDNYADRDQQQSAPMSNVGYLVVGTGDFDNNRQRLIFSSLTSSITITVKHAGICITESAGSFTGVDSPNGGTNPTTSFGFYNLGGLSPQVSFSADRSDCTAGNATVAAGQQDTSNTINKTVTITGLSQENLRDGDVRYYGAVVVTLNSTGASQQNSFRLEASRASDRVGYEYSIAKRLSVVTNDPTLDELSFNLANTDLPKNAVSTYKLEAALGCKVESNSVSGFVRFYDVDDGEWQKRPPNFSGDYNYPSMRFKVYAKDRSASNNTAFSERPIVNEQVNGSDAEWSNKIPFTMDKNKAYLFELSGVSRPNAVVMKVAEDFELSMLNTDTECLDPWEYDHDSFNVLPGKIERDTPYPVVKAGEEVTLRGSVKNVDQARGPNYEYRFQYRIGAEGQPWLNISKDEKNALNARDSSLIFDRVFTIPETNKRICFRAGISPFKGTRNIITNTNKNESTGWRDIPEGPHKDLDIHCVKVGDTTTWDNVHDFGINQSGTILPDTSVTPSGSVKNVGDGTSLNYTYKFQRKIVTTATASSAAYIDYGDPISASALAPGQVSNGGNKFVGAAYTVPAIFGGSRVTQVCFQAVINRAEGRATPLPKEVTLDVKNSAERCVAVNANPTPPTCQAFGTTAQIYTTTRLTTATLTNPNANTMTVSSAIYTINTPSPKTGADTLGLNVAANGSTTYDGLDQAVAAPGDYMATWTFTWRVGTAAPGTVSCSAPVYIKSDPVIPPSTCPSYAPWPQNFQYKPVNFDLPTPPDALPASDPEPMGPTGDAWVNGTNSPFYFNVKDDEAKSTSRWVNVPQTGTARRWVYVYANYDPSIGVTNVSDVESATDQYGDPVAIGPIDYDGSAELDYTSLFQNYPYDMHNITVKYTRKYYVVPVDYTFSRTATLVWWRDKISDPWQPQGSFTGDSTRNYTTPSAAPWNRSAVWGPKSAWGTGTTSTISELGPQMPPCFLRDFSASSNAGNASLAPDPENPNQALFTWTPAAYFSIEGGQGSTRVASSVQGLNYTVRYWVEGSGGTTELPVKTFTINGSTTMPFSSSGTPQNEAWNGISVPVNLRAGQRVCWSVSLAQQEGKIRSDGSIASFSGPGIEQRCTTYVVDIPYTRMFGADVFSGGGFSELGRMCTANTAARAYSNMKGNSIGSFRGTGVQLALLATGQIRGVQSAALSNRDPRILSFANTTASGSYLTDYIFGGGFGSSMCAHNYYDDAAGTPAVTPAGGVVDISTLQSGKYHYIGPVTLTGQVTGNRRVVIFVTGRVVIRGNASGQFGYQSTSWGTNINDIPSLYVISGNDNNANANNNSGGEIFIDHSVRNMDGVYVAQPSSEGAGGEIYTCADEVNMLNLISQPSPNATALLTTSCRNQLRVNGAFLAKKVHLLRTLNSLRDSSVAEPANGPQARAAEIFQYSPELYLTGGGGLNSDTKMKIESYTALPPSL
jgi:hypothetical protein